MYVYIIINLKCLVSLFRVSADTSFSQHKHSVLVLYLSYIYIYIYIYIYCLKNNVHTVHMSYLFFIIKNCLTYRSGRTSLDYGETAEECVRLISVKHAKVGR